MAVYIDETAIVVNTRIDVVTISATSFLYKIGTHTARITDIIVTRISFLSRSVSLILQDMSINDEKYTAPY